MTPAKSIVNINGQRPSPLKINKESHSIRKSSSSSSISDAPPKQKQRQPVIIYTDSPKIIHAQKQEFMALVQKLTGCHSRSSDFDDDHKTTSPLKGSSFKEEGIIKVVEENDSSSGLMDENCGRVVGNYSSTTADNVSSSSVSPIINTENPLFQDMPLFTPNSMNFFFSPRLMYRYANSSAISSPSNMSNSVLSPSVFDFIKGLPEY
ncbi:hypothetical protein SLEP1_g53518 [Rubroshorea leprosula]|uniref:VQ domain-containing protein n=1 Tax=Rubroshorea leprosula TaxID=152421 RepID=A0AAV5MAI4_9ROSI|nr:hypothetical protein SLEP1_g53518 [Rubroshorea leprosula]